MTTSSERVDAAASLLASARLPGEAIANPPAEIAPANDAEAWAIHQALVARRGPLAGWKVGAASPTAGPGVGEISADTLHRGRVEIAASSFRLWAVEAEIAVTFARDLPPRGNLYEAEDVLGAVGSWHAAIEVLDTAFADWRGTPSLWKVADRQNHGALVLGAPSARAPLGPLGEVPVRLLIDGAPVFAHRGGNTAGDPTWLLVALANRLAGTARWIRAGDVVTTGSTTPFLQAKPGQRVTVELEGLAPAELVVGA